MTQASLSPELDPTLSLGGLKGSAERRASVGPEASLWLLALTSVTLMFASVLLVGLVAQGAGDDSYVHGFATAIAALTGGLGMVVVGYVLLVAHRAGYLGKSGGEGTGSEPITPDGLRMAPSIPAGLAYRKRQQRAEQQAERRRQARAIDAVEQKQQARRAPAQVHPAPEQTPARTQAVQAPPRPKAAPPQRVAAPARPAPARPAAARPTPARPAAAAPARVRPPVRSQARGVVRPAASPAFLRLNPPRVRPRGQAALLQVGAASVRAPFVPPRPQPVLPGFAPRP